MRILMFLAVAVCLDRIAAAQETRGEPAHEAARRPIDALLEKLPFKLLPIPAPRAEVPADDPVDQPAVHKVVLRISEEWFTSLIYREIDEQTLVEDVILGTPVSGTARTIGHPRIDLVPHPSQAAFDVVMHGTTVSDTTGRSGPAVIRSRCTTRFCAVKKVAFCPEKGFHSLPAVVSTNTRLVTGNVASTRGGLIGRIVRRRAWQEVRAKHAQAQAIADGKARRRVAQVLDEELDAGLARLNRRNDVRGLIAALVTGTSAPLLACCSTEHYVQIGLPLGPGTQPIDLPPAGYLTSPIQLWVHRSLVRPRLPAILSRLDNDQFGVSHWVSLAQVAPTAALGAELLKTATNRIEESAPVDVTTVEDWMVLEFGKDARPGRIVRR